MITSRSVFAPVMIISSRSIPSPQPLAGGIPYSSARTNSSSLGCGSASAPVSWRSRCLMKRSRCSIGSLRSVPPPTISIPATMPSKASQTRGLSGCTLTSGQMSIGRSMM